MLNRPASSVRRGAQRGHSRSRCETGTSAWHVRCTPGHGRHPRDGCAHLVALTCQATNVAIDTRFLVLDDRNPRQAEERGKHVPQACIWIAMVATVVLAGLGVVGASAAPPATADATAVTQWNLIAVSRSPGSRPGLPGPAGGAPPASQINMGMVQGAVYDAVNAITPKHHRPYLLNRRFGNTASDEAAVATAAYLVLKNIVETVPQSITLPQQGDPARVARVAVQSGEERDTRLAVQGTWGSLPGPRRRRR